MNELNKVLLIGRLGADPETRETGGGKPVTRIRIATTDKWKDRETGERQERTEWHNVIAFDGLAKILAEWTSKGSQVFVEGKLQTRKWEDKEGRDRYTTEVIAQSVQLLTKQDRKPASPPKQQQRAAPADDGGFDDDIPF